MGTFWRRFVKGAFWFSFSLAVIAFVAVGIWLIVEVDVLIGIIVLIGGPILTLAAHAILGMLLEFFDNVAAIKRQICVGGGEYVPVPANNWQCMNCGTINPLNSAFCDKCGNSKPSAFGGNQPWTAPAPVQAAPAQFVAAPAPAQYVAPAPTQYAAPAPTQFAAAPVSAAPMAAPVAPAATAVAEPAEWACAFCGEKNASDSVFCCNCGKPKN